MLRVKKIDHVALHVEDPAATGAFYTDVLGLARVPPPTTANPAAVQAIGEFLAPMRTGGRGGGMWVQAGESQVHLIPADPSEIRPNALGPHLAFEVEDFDEARSDLEQRGLSFVEAPEGLPFRQLWLLDPSGNTIEIWAPR
jgi:catechol 2,3-dioxygenase-like lactoylglutathione lyase family enzyme